MRGLIMEEQSIEFRYDTQLLIDRRDKDLDEDEIAEIGNLFDAEE